ncbi:dipeptide ABC transporter ATP-binding protein [Pannonibacter tanglangensis]|uniref:Dipeptide ABC transporter ATP-binding protein n=1 Tax=Pannonibacter tanglangensis TaxID=2750084 RepID=A0ABW9ZPX2_9HYPH|nr:ABC transporter ATP-binding protein [Pannonibacter sp. XCT-34]NBN64770.1 dipeptide ABC transporter ATP-binding protein [Pannonibacter sp. XCT-34]
MTYAAPLRATETLVPVLSLPPVVLAVDDLCVAYGHTPVVDRVTFTIRAGEVVALVGESGSGKTTTAQALIGLLPPGGRVTSGSIRFDGELVSGFTERQFQGLRGKRIALVPQDPGSSLNPVRTVGSQVAEVFRLHTDHRPDLIRREVLSLFERVGLSDPELRYDQYPHELSGGMKQRVLIAMAVALRPDLIIADEPTSALDVTVQRRILDLIDGLRRDFGTAVLLVTHDLGVASDRADRIVVLQKGRIQDSGLARDVLGSPSSPYTRQLLADAPSIAQGVRARPAPSADARRLVEVQGLRQQFATADGQTFTAVRDITFSVAAGTTHALVGESGSGKTTTARIIAGLQRPTSGTVRVDGVEVTALSGEALRHFRRKVQLVYQNPFQSLDPRQTVGQIIEEPLLNFGPVPAPERKKRVLALAERVHLDRALLARRPAALSGGQRQRVAIARALILDPSVLVLDEAVSALDVTVQARILELLAELQRDLGLTYLFVSHDLAVVRAIADTVSVFQAGQQVEQGPVETVFSTPATDCTRQLLAAIPGATLNARFAKPTA